MTTTATLPILYGRLLPNGDWFQDRDNPTQEYFEPVLMVQCHCGRRHFHGWDLRQGFGTVQQRTSCCSIGTYLVALNPALAHAWIPGTRPTRRRVTR